MTATVIEPVEATVGDTPLRLRFGGRAKYRLQSIGKNIDISELYNKRRGFVTTANWAWACAVDCPFESAEELAEAVRTGQAGPLVVAVMDCIRAAIPSAEKKTV